jgi:hypothetical protein
MFEKTIIPLALFLVIAAPALSESRREKVLVYDLRVSFEKDTESGTAGEERYDYYSSIVPYTIARSLESAGKFEVRKVDGMLPAIEAGSDLFFDQMGKIGAEHSAQYIITGSVTVTGKKLAVELIIINIRAKKIFNISGESLETGAELIHIIDEITGDIGQKLALYQEETERPKEPEKRVEVSPFMKVYRALENLSFGAKAGRFFIKGPFTHAYEDSDYLTPYLAYGITGWFGLSAEADLLKADNGNIFVLKRSSMLLHGLTLNGNFTYWFFTHFGARISVGGGPSISRIYLNISDNPFDNLVVKKQSVDPYINLSASFHIIFKPVELQFGSAYKHAFFKGGGLQLITVFCGVGFHI